MSKLLSIPEACGLYRVSRKTLYNWKNAGRLNIEKVRGKMMIDEKQLSLLAEKKSSGVELGSQSVKVTNLHKKIVRMEERIEQLEDVVEKLLHMKESPEMKSGSVKKSVITQSQGNYAEGRKQQAISKVKAVYIALSEQERKRITVTELGRLADTDRRTVKKYWCEITDIEN